MKVQRNEKVYLTETLYIKYMKEGYQHLLIICLESSCGCSGDICRSVPIPQDMRDISIPLGDVDLIITSYHINDRERTFSFSYALY